MYNKICCAVTGVFNNLFHVRVEDLLSDHTSLRHRQCKRRVVCMLDLPQLQQVLVHNLRP